MVFERVLGNICLNFVDTIKKKKMIATFKEI